MKKKSTFNNCLWIKRPCLPLYLWIPPILVLCASFLPLVYLIIRTIGVDSQLLDTLLRPRVFEVLLNSVGLALAVTVSGCMLGFFLAWLTTRTDLPAKKFWTIILSLPLVLPSYVGAFAWVAALGPRGLLQGWLEPFGVERLPSLYGFWGAWIILSLFSYPYVLLTVRAGFRGIDASLEDVARSLGKNSFQVFREILFPQLWPAIHAGALLIALYTLSDFGAVSLLQFNSFTQAIYSQYIGSFNRGVAAVLACVLVLLTLLILLFQFRIGGRSRYYRSSAGALRRVPCVSLGKWRYPALFFCGSIGIFALGLPVMVISYWLIRGWIHHQSVLFGAEIVWNSVSASGLAALVAVIAALPIVILAVRHARRSTQWLERSTYIGHALPGIVIAFSLVFFGVRYVPFLYQTLFMLIFAYVVHFLPHAVGSIRSSMLQISPRLEDAARNLGKKPFHVFSSLTLPLLKPGLLSGFALVFLSCMKELPATLLLGPIEFQTLATKIWNATEDAFFAKAAGPALILVLVSAMSIWIIFSQEESEKGR
ncbi:MAG: ABC transporter permease subunit [Kiritimatiellae bacterium]|nr:ABC transporter permease subunit [Kiritimatiellia bacterium]